MFPCSDWAPTPNLEYIPDSLGDIQRVQTQSILLQEWNNEKSFFLRLSPFPEEELVSDEQIYCEATKVYVLFDIGF